MTVTGPCLVHHARAACPNSASHPSLCMHPYENSIEYEYYAVDCMIITRIGTAEGLTLRAARSACSKKGRRILALLCDLTDSGRLSLRVCTGHITLSFSHIWVLKPPGCRLLE